MLKGYSLNRGEIWVDIRLNMLTEFAEFDEPRSQLSAPLINNET